MLRRVRVKRDPPSGSGQQRPPDSRHARLGARMASRVFGSPSVAWIALLVVAGAAAALLWRPLAPPSNPRGRVVFAFTLLGGGERGPRPSNGFDRLRIPADVTDIQLSLAIPGPAQGDRFTAELQAIDGGAARALGAPIVEPSSAGATVSIAMPVPPDGDYVLRLRRVSGSGSEVVATSAFRITRLRQTEAPSRPGRSSEPAGGAAAV